jgi:DNA-binding Lrp family transcriptional regulator
MMNVGNPDLAFSFAQLPNEGVGLARLEFVINNMIGLHPKAVLECHTVTGAWCYLLKLRLPDIAALETFVSDEVRGQSGVERTETILALASPKETAILPVAEAQEE